MSHYNMPYLPAAGELRPDKDLAQAMRAVRLFASIIRTTHRNEQCKPLGQSNQQNGSTLTKTVAYTAPTSKQLTRSQRSRKATK